MLYRFDLTVPPRTPETSPYRRRVTLIPGRVHRVFAFFPPDSAGLLKAGVEHRGSKIWPSNPDGWLLGENLLWEWDESFDLTDDPPELVLVGYNEDDAYSHTVYFAFALLEPRRAGLLERMARFMGVR